MNQAGGSPYPAQSRPRQPADQRQNPFQNLTAEEIAVLKECNRQSFYYRCVPFAVLSGIAIQWAVKAGYLTTHPKWGTVPKLVGACAVSYILGKWSYRHRCVDMILSLPNSPLAASIRRNRGRFSAEDTVNFIQTAPDTGLGFPTHDVRDVDTSRTASSYSQAEQRERLPLNLSPSSALPPDGETSESSPVRYRSFDDLRRENRAEFANRRFTSDGGRILYPPSGRDLQTDAPQTPSYSGYAAQPAPLPSLPSSEDSNLNKRYQRKNKYGDFVED